MTVEPVFAGVAESVRVRPVPVRVSDPFGITLGLEETAVTVSWDTVLISSATENLEAGCRVHERYGPEARGRLGVGGLVRRKGGRLVLRRKEHRGASVGKTFDCI